MVLDLTHSAERGGSQVWADAVGSVPVCVIMPISKIRWLARCEPEPALLATPPLNKPAPGLPDRDHRGLRLERCRWCGQAKPPGPATGVMPEWQFLPSQREPPASAEVASAEEISDRCRAGSRRPLVWVHWLDGSRVSP